MLRTFTTAVLACATVAVIGGCSSPSEPGDTERTPTRTADVGAATDSGDGNGSTEFGTGAESLSARATPDQGPTAEAIAARSEPTPLSAIASPDGRWRAQVLTWPCDLDSALGLERLVLQEADIESVMGEQVIDCGGLGAYGYQILDWSADSRTLYYHEGRLGQPEGCGVWYPWVRAMDAQTGVVTDVGSAVRSQDGARIAAWQEDSLVIWDAAAGKQQARIELHGDGGGGAIAWHPDSRRLVYLVQDERCPGDVSHADVWRLDLLPVVRTERVAQAVRGVDGVKWFGGDDVTLTDGEGRSHELDMNTGLLTRQRTPPERVDAGGVASGSQRVERWPDRVPVVGNRAFYVLADPPDSDGLASERRLLVTAPLTGAFGAAQTLAPLPPGGVWGADLEGVTAFVDRFGPALVRFRSDVRAESAGLRESGQTRLEYDPPESWGVYAPTAVATYAGWQLVIGADGVLRVHDAGVAELTELARLKATGATVHSGCGPSMAVDADTGVVWLTDSTHVYAIAVDDAGQPSTLASHWASDEGCVVGLEASGGIAVVAGHGANEPNFDQRGAPRMHVMALGADGEIEVLGSVSRGGCEVPVALVGSVLLTTDSAGCQESAVTRIWAQDVADPADIVQLGRWEIPPPGTGGLGPLVVHDGQVWRLAVDGAHRIIQDVRVPAIVD